MHRRKEIEECVEYVKGLESELGKPPRFVINSDNVRDFLSVFLAIYTKRLSCLTKWLIGLTVALILLTVALLVSAIITYT